MPGRIHAFVIRLNPQEEALLAARHKASETTLPLSTWARQRLLEPSNTAKIIRGLASLGLVDTNDESIKRMMEG